MSEVTDVSFNDNSLNLALQIYNVNVDEYPDFEIRRYPVARGDKSITSSKEAVQKQIIVKGYICGNRNEIETGLLVLKLSVYGASGQLKVRQIGSDVIYTATCDQMNLDWHRNQVEVELIFIASDPYGKVQPSTSLALPNITAATYDFSLAAGSTAVIKPKINLNFVDVVDGTNKTVSIRNSDTRIGISITNDFVDGDTLYIDSENLIVTLNGVPVDFTGSFPQFLPTLAAIFVPSVNITYTDDFTSRDVIGSFNYNVRY